MWGWFARLWGSQGSADGKSSSGGLHTPTTVVDQGRLQPKYILTADGKAVGIANTTSKYKESRPLPVRPHLTPFEARVAKMQQEEERVTGGIKAGTADAAGGLGGCRSTAAGGNDATAKQLFAAAPGQ